MPTIGPPTTDAELFELFSRIGRRWSDEGKSYSGYFVSYNEETKIAALREFIKSALADQVPEFPGSVGCDIGCWLGFTCVLQLASGAGHVFGIEMHEPFVASCREYRDKEELSQLTFAHIKMGSIPLQSESVDWVFVNQVMCNMFPDSFDTSLAEGVRVLKPGGTLLLCDSNNPYCDDTLKRLLETYRTYEIGANGTLDAPSGRNVQQRQVIIKDVAPQLQNDVVLELARNTAYMWGDAIRDAVLTFVQTGRKPSSRFTDDVSRTVINPQNGGALGQITNPYSLAAMLEKFGMKASITTSPALRNLSNQELLAQLEQSQGFYIYARKPG